jgi:CBS domain containing-hemolysin-like protein
VTVEDIVEEIVGEIHDEYDSEEFFMQYISDDEYIFNGRVDLDDINALMSANLPTDENDTLGGLIYNTLGRVPEAGDALDVGDLHITVLEVIGRRIGTVKVERLRLDIQQTETAGESIKADKNTSPLVNNRPHNAVSEST